MHLVTDQTGRQVEVPENPQRIISLVPSQTELLHSLGLGDRVVGLTKFCVHPEEWHQKKQRVGGTKIIKHKVIDELAPDLIIANKEENTREDIERLAHNYPVWVSDVYTLNDALKMIEQVGQLTQTNLKASELMTTIKRAFDELQLKVEKITEPKRALYLIWRKPYMAAGKQTFVDDMLQKCGFINVVSDARYPELKEADIIRMAPELVLFSSEPFPFREDHMEALQKILPHSKLQLVDGEPFSWYGNRLAGSPAYFIKLLDIIKNDT